MGCLIDFTFIERGCRLGGFYLMGLGCKKKRGSKMLNWDTANGNDYNLNCVNQNQIGARYESKRLLLLNPTPNPNPNPNLNPNPKPPNKSRNTHSV